MRRLGILFLILCSTIALPALIIQVISSPLSGSGTTPLQTGIPALVSEIKTESVYVETCTGFGTGVIFNRKIEGREKTFVWTCGHVIRGASLTKENSTNALNCYILIRYGCFKYPAHVVAMSGELEPVDAALLLVDAPIKGSKSVRFNFGTPEVGERVVTLGDAGHLMAPMSFFQGYFVTRGRNLFGRSEDQYQCSVYPGCSGGGIFNLNGECVGLVFARHEETTLFDVPSRRLLEWSRNNHIEWALDESVPMPSMIPRPTFIKNYE